MSKDDVDTLAGQALADAVAVEVMGWRRKATVYGDVYVTRATAHTENVLSVCDWHPESSWSDFGAVVDRIAELGDDSWGWTLWWGPEDALFRSFYEVPFSKRDDAHGEVAGSYPRVVFLRAALKAVRAVRARDEDYAAAMAAQARRETTRP